MNSQMIPVTSSKIKAVYFDAQAMILKIEFLRDGLFEYYGVPERIFNELLEADSPGLFFKRFIKDKFRYVKVG